jgi:hypothetical protein
MHPQVWARAVAAGGLALKDGSAAGSIWAGAAGFQETGSWSYWSTIPRITGRSRLVIHVVRRKLHGRFLENGTEVSDDDWFAGDTNAEIYNYFVRIGHPSHWCGAGSLQENQIPVWVGFLPIEDLSRLISNSAEPQAIETIFIDLFNLK